MQQKLDTVNIVINKLLVTRSKYKNSPKMYKYIKSSHKLLFIVKLHLYKLIKQFKLAQINLKL